MIVERGRGSTVIVRHRDSEGKRQTTKITGHRPYLYVEEHIDVIPLETESGFTGLYGEKLKKVFFNTTQDLTEFRSSNPDTPTWEGNIPFTNRVLVDSEFDCPNYEHRVWFLDMEWKIDGGEITIIVVRDSIKGEFVFFTHEDYEAGNYTSIPCKNHPYEKEPCETDGRSFKAFSNESDMLYAFAKLLNSHDPDILTGWNVVNADIQQLFKRFKHNNIDVRMLSPMRRVRYEFGDWGQPIVGTNVIDLMIAFSKLWVMKNGQLPSMALDAVSLHCLKDKKVPLEDGHDTYYTDFGPYLEYARQDVDLLPRLNDLVDALGYYTALQHIVGCDIRSTPFITKMFTYLSIRDKDFDRKIPTKPQFDKVEYEGAEIMKPQAGVYKNIGIFDVRAMYHSNVDKYGICWTTLDERGQDCGNGIKFSMDKKGLLCRQMDKMTELRNIYKKKMKESETEMEKKRYDALQFATKSLVASMYGVAGDAKFGMYHPDIAAAITFTSRQTLGELRDHAEELGFPVVYGHTDSIMCRVPNPEKGVEALSIINEKMKPIITEFEKWSSAFLIMAKNRYAGMVKWTDGSYHEREFYVKGIEMKQSRMPKAMKTAMSYVIDAILTDTKEEVITMHLGSLISKVVNGDIPVEELTIKAKLKNDLSKYSVISEARAGAKWANDNLGKGYRKGDYFLCTIDEEGEYIGFDSPDEIEGIAKIGYKQLADKYILSKVLPYYEVMGWDSMPLENKLRGIGDMEWI